MSETQNLINIGAITGSIIEGEENGRYDRVWITYIGRERFACRWWDAEKGEWGEERMSTTLFHRKWYVVNHSLGMMNTTQKAIDTITKLTIERNNAIDNFKIEAGVRVRVENDLALANSKLRNAEDELQKARAVIRQQDLGKLDAVEAKVSDEETRELIKFKDERIETLVREKAALAGSLAQREAMVYELEQKLKEAKEESDRVEGGRTKFCESLQENLANCTSAKVRLQEAVFNSDSKARELTLERTVLADALKGRYAEIKELEFKLRSHAHLSQEFDEALKIIHALRVLADKGGKLWNFLERNREHLNRLGLE